MRTNSSVALAKKPKDVRLSLGLFAVHYSDAFGKLVWPISAFCLAHPWDVKGLGQFIPSS